MRCPNCGVELGLKLLGEPERTTETSPSVDHVRVALGDYAKLLNFETGSGIIVVKPKYFLGKERFAQISEQLKQFDAQYVSEGKNSRWEI